VTYLVVDLPFLAVAIALAAVTWFRGRRGSVAAWAAALAVLLVMTAVFDNVLVGTGIVGYDPALISGVRIGVAPIEDFAYAIAGALLLPALWDLLPRSERAGRASTAGGARGAERPAAQGADRAGGAA